jgi:1-deoxy-D-xylulose-5-phosphate synthase
MLFEDMGLIYIGPVDGHNIQEMVTAFETAASIADQPVIVHVLTKKGKGYKPAEKHPSIFHGVGPFHIRSGELYTHHDNITYTNIFSGWMCARGEQNSELVSVCAAMPDGTGLTEFAKSCPERFFDVGIAEEHAVTFAAGLAAGGMRPVVSIYSTFLQRAYDQMIHDVCLNSLPVIFAVDRSGIVGRDGETHQGIYDISYLSSMPNMTVISPMDGEELVQALDFALEQEDGPVAVRYPRGEAFQYEREGDDTSGFSFAKAEILKKGRDVVILAVGNMVRKALSAAVLLEKKRIHPTVVNMRFVKPFDEELVLQLAKKNRLIVTMEDNIYSGGFAERIQAFLQANKKGRVKCLPICFPDAFIEHGDTEELYEKYGLDAQSVAERIEQQL